MAFQLVHDAFVGVSGPRVLLCHPFKASKRNAQPVSQSTSSAPPSTTVHSGAASEAKKRRGSLASIQVAGPQPNQTGAVAKKPNNAPIVLVIWQYGDEARDLVDAFPPNIPTT